MTGVQTCALPIWDIQETLKIINSNTEGICCWSWGRLREHQNIRWANSRWYRYHMPPDHYSEQYISDMNRAMMEFIGEHDFRRFCKSREEKNPVVRVERTKVQDLSGSGEMVIIDVIGPRFLWNQVRRMVGTAMKFADGMISLDDIIELLNAEEDDDRIKRIQSKIPLIPSTGLILMDVHFKDVEFERSPDAAGILARRYRERAWKGSMRVLLHTAVRGVVRMEIKEGREDGKG